MNLSHMAQITPFHVTPVEDEYTPRSVQPDSGNYFSTDSKVCYPLMNFSYNIITKSCWISFR